MPVYLTIGKNNCGEYLNIESQLSGKTNLFCPFCKCPLIAVKGKVKQHHFRHNGETCNESLTEIPVIPGWHHFHLNYPSSVVDSLKNGFKPKSKSPLTFRHWENNVEPVPMRYASGLLKDSYWNDNKEFTETARVIIGQLSLSSFANWMRKQLQSRINDFQSTENFSSFQGSVRQVYYEIEASRQQNILNSTLYFFEYHLNNNSIIHKIGRSQRKLSDRLKETVIDLESETGCKVIKSKIIRSVANAGHVEKYCLYKYSTSRANFENLTEYLQLDANTLKQLKSEFTRLANSIEPFDKQEKFIVSGRWRYEEKRLSASKRGIKLTIMNEGKFGRPVGSSLTQSQYLDKYREVVDMAQYGFSISEIAKLLSISKSTVKRVKAEFKKTDI